MLVPKLGGPCPLVALGHGEAVGGCGPKPFVGAREVGVSGLSSGAGLAAPRVPQRDRRLLPGRHVGASSLQYLRQSFNYSRASARPRSQCALNPNAPLDRGSPGGDSEQRCLTLASALERGRCNSSASSMPSRQSCRPASSCMLFSTTMARPSIPRSWLGSRGTRARASTSPRPPAPGSTLSRPSWPS